MNDSQKFEIPSQVSLVVGQGGLPKLLIETPSSRAEIYLQGAQITHFQKKGEVPLLFVSASSDFAARKPIRGGVPIVFPWFGGREGLPAHGFARIETWQLTATLLLPNRAVRLHFSLPTSELYEVEWIITVSDKLAMELIVMNNTDENTTFETCLHTYFQVSDINSISITGLSGAQGWNNITGSDFVEGESPILFTAETEIVYSNTTATVEIVDPLWSRKTRVVTSGSNSTVVWNPWIEKSKCLRDFGDDEYLQMLCVESGNIARNEINLPPRGSTSLKVELSSEVMAHQS